MYRARSSHLEAAHGSLGMYVVAAATRHLSPEERKKEMDHFVWSFQGAEKRPSPSPRAPSPEDFPSLAGKVATTASAVEDMGACAQNATAASAAEDVSRKAQNATGAQASEDEDWASAQQFVVYDDIYLDGELVKVGFSIPRPQFKAVFDTALNMWVTAPIDPTPAPNAWGTAPAVPAPAAAPLPARAKGEVASQVTPMKFEAEKSAQKVEAAEPAKVEKAAEAAEEEKAEETAEKTPAYCGEYIPRATDVPTRAQAEEAAAKAAKKAANKAARAHRAQMKREANLALKKAQAPSRALTKAQEKAARRPAQPKKVQPFSLGYINVAKEERVWEDPKKQRAADEEQQWSAHQAKFLAKKEAREQARLAHKKTVDLEEKEITPTLRGLMSDHRQCMLVYKSALNLRDSVPACTECKVPRAQEGTSPIGQYCQLARRFDAVCSCEGETPTYQCHPRVIRCAAQRLLDEYEEAICVERDAIIAERRVERAKREAALLEKMAVEPPPPSNITGWCEKFESPEDWDEKVAKQLAAMRQRELAEKAAAEKEAWYNSHKMVQPGTPAPKASELEATSRGKAAFPQQLITAYAKTIRNEAYRKMGVTETTEAVAGHTKSLDFGLCRQMMWAAVAKNSAHIAQEKKPAEKRMRRADLIAYADAHELKDPEVLNPLDVQKKLRAERFAERNYITPTERHQLDQDVRRAVYSAQTKFLYGPVLQHYLAAKKKERRIERRINLAAKKKMSPQLPDVGRLFVRQTEGLLRAWEKSHLKAVEITEEGKKRLAAANVQWRKLQQKMKQTIPWDKLPATAEIYSSGLGGSVWLKYTAMPYDVMRRLAAEAEEEEFRKSSFTELSVLRKVWRKQSKQKKAKEAARLKKISEKMRARAIKAVAMAEESRRGSFTSVAFSEAKEAKLAAARTQYHKALFDKRTHCRVELVARPDECTRSGRLYDTVEKFFKKTEKIETATQARDLLSWLKPRSPKFHEEFKEKLCKGGTVNQTSTKIKKEKPFKKLRSHSEKKNVYNRAFNSDNKFKWSFGTIFTIILIILSGIGCAFSKIEEQDLGYYNSVPTQSYTLLTLDEMRDSCSRFADAADELFLCQKTYDKKSNCYDDLKITPTDFVFDDDDCLLNRINEKLGVKHDSRKMLRQMQIWTTQRISQGLRTNIKSTCGIKISAPIPPNFFLGLKDLVEGNMFCSMSSYLSFLEDFLATAMETPLICHTFVWEHEVQPLYHKECPDMRTIAPLAAEQMSFGSKASPTTFREETQISMAVNVIPPKNGDDIGHVEEIYSSMNIPSSKHDCHATTPMTETTISVVTQVTKMVRVTIDHWITQPCTSAGTFLAAEIDAAISQRLGQCFPTRTTTNVVGDQPINKVKPWEMRAMMRRAEKLARRNHRRNLVGFEVEAHLLKFVSINKHRLEYYVGKPDTNLRVWCSIQHREMMPIGFSMSKNTQFCSDGPIETDFAGINYDCGHCWKLDMLCHVRTEVIIENSKYVQEYEVTCVPKEFVKDQHKRQKRALPDILYETPVIGSTLKSADGWFKKTVEEKVASLSFNWVVLAAILLMMYPTFGFYPILFFLAFWFICLAPSAEAGVLIEEDMMRQIVEVNFSEKTRLCVLVMPAQLRTDLAIGVAARGVCDLPSIKLYLKAELINKFYKPSQAYFFSSNYGLCFTRSYRESRKLDAEEAMKLCNAEHNAIVAEFKTFDDKVAAEDPIVSTEAPTTAPFDDVVASVDNSRDVEAEYMLSQDSEPKPEVRETKSRRKNRSFSATLSGDDWSWKTFSKMFTDWWSNFSTPWKSGVGTGVSVHNKKFTDRILALFKGGPQFFMACAFCFVGFFYAGIFGAIGFALISIMVSDEILTVVPQLIDFILAVTVAFVALKKFKSSIMAGVFLVLMIWWSPVSSEAACSNAVTGTLIGRREMQGGRMVNVSDGVATFAPSTCLYWNIQNQDGSTKSQILTLLSAYRPINLEVDYEAPKTIFVDYCHAYKCGGQTSFSVDCHAWLNVLKRLNGDLVFSKTLYDEENFGYKGLNTGCAFGVWGTAMFAVSFKGDAMCKFNRVMYGNLITVVFQMTTDDVSVVKTAIIREGTPAQLDGITIWLEHATSDHIPKWIVVCQNEYFMVNDEVSFPSNLPIRQKDGEWDSQWITDAVSCDSMYIPHWDMWKCTTSLRGVKESIQKIGMSRIQNDTDMPLNIRNYQLHMSNVTSLQIKLRVPGILKESAICKFISLTATTKMQSTLSHLHHATMKVTVQKTPCTIQLDAQLNSVCGTPAMEIPAVKLTTELVLEANCHGSGPMELVYQGIAVKFDVEAKKLWDYIHDIGTVIVGHDSDWAAIAPAFNFDTLVKNPFGSVFGFISKAGANFVWIALVFVALLFINKLFAVLFLIIVYGVYSGANAELLSDQGDGPLEHEWLHVIGVDERLSGYLVAIVGWFVAKFGKKGEKPNVAWKYCLGKSGLSILTFIWTMFYVNGPVSSDPMFDGQVWWPILGIYLAYYYLLDCCSVVCKSVIFDIVIGAIFERYHLGPLFCLLKAIDSAHAFIEFGKCTQMSKTVWYREMRRVVLAVGDTVRLLGFLAFIYFCQGMYIASLVTAIIVLILRFSGMRILGTNIIWCLHTVMPIHHFGDIVCNNPLMFNLESMGTEIKSVRLSKCTQVDENDWCVNHRGLSGTFATQTSGDVKAGTYIQVSEMWEPRRNPNVQMNCMGSMKPNRWHCGYDYHTGSGDFLIDFFNAINSNLLNTEERLAWDKLGSTARIGDTEPVWLSVGNTVTVIDEFNKRRAKAIERIRNVEVNDGVVTAQQVTEGLTQVANDDTCSVLPGCRPGRFWEKVLPNMPVEKNNQVEDQAHCDREQYKSITPEGIKSEPGDCFYAALLAVTDCKESTTWLRKQLADVIEAINASHHKKVVTAIRKVGYWGDDSVLTALPQYFDVAFCIHEFANGNPARTITFGPMATCNNVLHLRLERNVHFEPLIHVSGFREVVSATSIGESVAKAAIEVSLINDMDRVKETILANVEFMPLSARVDYSFIQQVGCTMGLDSYFEKKNFLPPTFPQILQMNTEYDIGFAFVWQSVIYTNYHVTNGHSIVYPCMNPDGTNQLTVLKPSAYDSTSDVVSYGGQTQLMTPVAGKWYFVINPASQNCILFQFARLEKIDGANTYIYKRMVQVSHQGKRLVKNTNIFGFYGWSGLPICDVETGVPVGIYGYIRFMRNDGIAYNLSSSFAHHNVHVDWEEKIKDIDAGGHEKLHELYAPTGTGKSTAFPIALAANLLNRKGKGLIVIANPRRATCVHNYEYIGMKIKQGKLAGRVDADRMMGDYSTVMNIGDVMNKAGKKVVILCITYGMLVNAIKKLKTDYLLLDECHERDPEVRFIVSYVEGAFSPKTTCTSFIKEEYGRVVKLTATPSGQSGADRSINEIPIPKQEVGKRNAGYVQLTNDLWFDKSQYQEGRKHLIFMASKTECEQAKKILEKAFTKKINVWTFYSMHQNQLGSVYSFNYASTGILIATNAVQTGLTPVGCTDVWDSMHEYIETYNEASGSLMYRRKIDRKAMIQRRGRAGRTCQTANYWYPEGMKEVLIDEYPDDICTLFKVAAFYKFANLQTTDVPDDLRPQYDRLEEMYRGVPSTVWSYLIYSELDPWSLWLLSTKTEAAGTEKPVWHKMDLERAFQPAIVSKRFTVNNILSTFPNSDAVRENKINHFRFTADMEQRAEMNSALPIVAGCMSALVCFWGAMELASQFVRFVKVSCIWTMQRDSFSDLGWDVQWYLVDDYRIDQLSAKDANACDPHLMMEHRLFRYFTPTVKLVRDYLPPGQMASLNTDTKKYIIVTSCITATGLWHLLPHEGFDTQENTSEYQPIKIGLYNMTIDSFKMLTEAMTFHHVDPMLMTHEDQLERAKYAKVDTIETNSVDAIIATYWKTLMAHAYSISPHAATILANLANLGTIAVGGVAIAWDQLVKNFGSIGAMIVSALTVAITCSPNMIIGTCVGGMLGYAAKVCIIGTPSLDNGVKLPATPLALGGSLLIGSLASTLHRAELSYAASNSTLVVCTGAKGVGNGSIVVAVKNMYYTLRVLARCWRDKTCDGTDFAGVLANIGTCVSMLAGMTVVQQLVVVGASCLLTMIWTMAKSDRKFIRSLCATVIRNENIWKDVEDDWSPHFEQLVLVCLSIASYIVQPTSSITFVCMAGWYVLEQYLRGHVLTREELFEKVEHAFHDAAGVNVVVGAASVIISMVKFFGVNDPAISVPSPVESGAVKERVEQNSVISPLLAGLSTAFSAASAYMSLNSLSQEGICEKLREWMKLAFAKLVGGFAVAWEFVKYFFHKIKSIVWPTDTEKLAKTVGMDVWSRDFPVRITNAERIVVFSINPYMAQEAVEEACAMFHGPLSGKTSNILRYIFNRLGEVKYSSYIGSAVSMYHIVDCKKFQFNQIKELVTVCFGEKAKGLDIEANMTTNGEFICPGLCMCGAPYLTKQGFFYFFLCDAEPNFPVIAAVHAIGGMIVVTVINNPFDLFLNSVKEAVACVLDKAMECRLRQLETDTADKHKYLEQSELGELVGKSDESASLLGSFGKTVSQWIDRGKLVTKLNGKHFTTFEVDAFAERLRKAAEAKMPEPMWKQSNYPEQTALVEQLTEPIPGDYPYHPKWDEYLEVPKILEDILSVRCPHPASSTISWTKFMRKVDNSTLPGGVFQETKPNEMPQEKKTTLEFATDRQSLQYTVLALLQPTCRDEPTSPIAIGAILDVQEWLHYGTMGLSYPCAKDAKDNYIVLSEDHMCRIQFTLFGNTKGYSGCRFQMQCDSILVMFKQDDLRAWLCEGKHIYMHFAEAVPGYINFVDNEKESVASQAIKFASLVEGHKGMTLNEISKKKPIAASTNSWSNEFKFYQDLPIAAHKKEVEKAREERKRNPPPPRKEIIPIPQVPLQDLGITSRIVPFGTPEYYALAEHSIERMNSDLQAKGLVKEVVREERPQLNDGIDEATARVTTQIERTKSKLQEDLDASKKSLEIFKVKADELDQKMCEEMARAKEMNERLLAIAASKVPNAITSEIGNETVVVTPEGEVVKTTKTTEIKKKPTENKSKVKSVKKSVTKKPKTNEPTVKEKVKGVANTFMDMLGLVKKNAPVSREIKKDRQKSLEPLAIPIHVAETTGENGKAKKRQKIKKITTKVSKDCPNVKLPRCQDKNRRFSWEIYRQNEDTMIAHFNKYGEFKYHTLASFLASASVGMLTTGFVPPPPFFITDKLWRIVVLDTFARRANLRRVAERKVPLFPKLLINESPKKTSTAKGLEQRRQLEIKHVGDVYSYYLRQLAPLTVGKPMTMEQFLARYDDKSFSLEIMAVEPTKTIMARAKKLAEKDILSESESTTECPVDTDDDDEDPIAPKIVIETNKFSMFVIQLVNSVTPQLTDHDFELLSFSLSHEHRRVSELLETIFNTSVVEEFKKRQIIESLTTSYEQGQNSLNIKWQEIKTSTHVETEMDHLDNLGDIESDGEDLCEEINLADELAECQSSDGDNKEDECITSDGMETANEQTPNCQTPELESKTVPELEPEETTKDWGDSQKNSKEFDWGQFVSAKFKQFAGAFEALNNYAVNSVANGPENLAPALKEIKENIAVEPVTANIVNRAVKARNAVKVKFMNIEPSIDRTEFCNLGTFQHLDCTMPEQSVSQLQREIQSLKPEIDQTKKLRQDFFSHAGNAKPGRVPDVGLNGYYILSDLDKQAPLGIREYSNVADDDAEIPTFGVKSRQLLQNKHVLDYTPGRGGSTLYLLTSLKKSFVTTYQDDNDAFKMIESAKRSDKSNYLNHVSNYADLITAEQRFDIVVNDSCDFVDNVVRAKSTEVCKKFLDSVVKSIPLLEDSNNAVYIYSISDVEQTAYYAPLACFNKFKIVKPASVKNGRCHTFVVCTGGFSSFAPIILDSMSDLCNSNYDWVDVNAKLNRLFGQIAGFTSVEKLKAHLCQQWIEEFTRQLTYLRGHLKRHWRQKMELTYPRLSDTTIDWALTTSVKHVSSETESDDLKRAFEPHYIPLQTLQNNVMKDGKMVRMLKPRIDRYVTTAQKAGLRLYSAQNANILQHQRVLATYKKQDRLTTDKTILSSTLAQLAHDIFGWHPTNSVVNQVSKDRVHVLESIQTRFDRAPAYIQPEVMAELYECIPTIAKPPAQLLKPWTLEKTMPLINKMGAAGLFDNWGKMQDCLDDPRTPGLVNDCLHKLTNGLTCDEYYGTVHNKVESKVGGSNPRLISYFGCIARIVDWMVFGPFVQHHYKTAKLFKYTSGGTPISEMGDKMWKIFNSFNEEEIKVPTYQTISDSNRRGRKQSTARSMTGDASKWDHSLGPDYQSLECYFMCTNYDPACHDLICNIYEHVMWPVLFTRLGFCFTVTGHRCSGWILTWMNSFGNVLFHNRAWKKALGLPMSADLDEYVDYLCDGDDNVHFFNRELLLRDVADVGVQTGDIVYKVRHYMKQCNITIRSGTFEGYRIHEDFPTVDFLSHTYTPVYVVAKEPNVGVCPLLKPTRRMEKVNTGVGGVFSKPHTLKMMPYRPLAEMLGKLSFTLKVASSRNTTKHALDFKTQYDQVGEAIYGGTANKGQMVHEGIQFEASKAASYLFMYPHVPGIRAITLACLSILGFPGDNKYFNTWRMIHKIGNLKWHNELNEILDTTLNRFTSVISAIRNIYGDQIKTLDDISMCDFDQWQLSVKHVAESVVDAYDQGYKKENKWIVDEFRDLIHDDIKLQKFCSHNAIIHRTLRKLLRHISNNGHFQAAYPEYFGLWNPMLKTYSYYVGNQQIDVGKLEKLELIESQPAYNWQTEFSIDSLFQKMKDTYEYISKKPEVLERKDENISGRRQVATRKLPPHWRSGMSKLPQQYSVPITSPYFGKTKIMDMLDWLNVVRGGELVNTQKNSDQSRVLPILMSLPSKLGGMFSVRSTNRADTFTLDNENEETFDEFQGEGRGESEKIHCLQTKKRRNLKLIRCGPILTLEEKKETFQEKITNVIICVWALIMLMLCTLCIIRPCFPTKTVGQTRTSLATRARVFIVDIACEMVKRFVR